MNTLYRETVTHDTSDGRINWPFPSVNGQQTPASVALMADKGQHKPTPKDLSDIEGALV
jgi:hypothetical protein